MLGTLTHVAAYGSDPRYSIGLNKYDLFTQYTGTASGGNGSPAYMRVTRAMARKSLEDAKDIGVRYMRVSMSGRTAFKGAEGDSLSLWRSDPDAFWRLVDLMMNDLDANDIQLVPVLMWGGSKFQVMAGERTTDLLNDPHSKSWALLASFVTQFVTRYRDRRTILFYELTNEFNNSVDLDQEKRCAKAKRKPRCEVSENFSADELIAFTKRFAGLVRSLDASRKISSGFSIPRPAAEHLRVRPQWAAQGPDWTKDSREQFAKNLRDLHAAVDIISIHLYGGENNRRFGSTNAVDLLVEAKHAADAVGKPLFVGEFGDPKPGKGTDTHTARMIDKIVELGVPYSAVWVWQLYQNSTFSTHNTAPSNHSLEPGYTDALIKKIRKANVATGTGAVGKHGQDTRPPRIVLTWPLECSHIHEGQSIHAVASDDSGAVDRVELWLDERRLGSYGKPPFATGLAPGDVAGSGTRVLKARAFDAAGNHSEYSTRVLVNPTPGQKAACLTTLR